MTDAQSTSIDRWYDYITTRLGREPRGLREIAAFNDRGEPAVIRVASVVDGAPFPTLYWLIDPTLCLALDRLEAGGAIARLQALVDQSEDLQQSMRLDHERHQRVREAFVSAADRQFLEEKDLWPALNHRGIGGIADFTRIRCLHTWYGAHMVESNTIGRLIDDILTSPNPI